MQASGWWGCFTQSAALLKTWCGVHCVLCFLTPHVQSMLLFGPPGTGKTFIAESIARAAGLNFLCVNAEQLTCSAYGDSEKQVNDGLP